jgi:hypothetical protein
MPASTPCAAATQPGSALGVCAGAAGSPVLRGGSRQSAMMTGSWMMGVIAAAAIHPLNLALTARRTASAASRLLKK